MPGRGCEVALRLVQGPLGKGDLAGFLFRVSFLHYLCRVEQEGIFRDRRLTAAYCPRARTAGIPGLMLSFLAIRQHRFVGPAST